MSKRLNGIVGLLIAAASLPALAGGFAGNGTDWPDTHDGLDNMAWFSAKDRAIHTCVEVSPLFPVSDATVRGEIRDVFATWGDYFRKRVLSTGELKEIVTTIDLMPRCDGTEDLKFDFGTIGSEVQAELANHARAMGFAKRTSFDFKSGWGRGFVWIAPQAFYGARVPDWGEPAHLRAILLHEVGHVLGNGHVPGTIMREELGSDIAVGNDDPGFQARMQRIDDTRQLVYCVECNPYVLAPALSNRPTLEVGFQSLLGVAPTGAVSATLTPQFTSSFDHSKHPERFKASLVLNDQAGHHEIELNAVSVVHDFNVGGASVFTSISAGLQVTSWWSEGEVILVSLVPSEKGSSARMGILTLNDAFTGYLKLDLIGSGEAGELVEFAKVEILP